MSQTAMVKLSKLMELRYASSIGQGLHEQELLDSYSPVTAVSFQWWSPDLRDMDPDTQDDQTIVVAPDPDQHEVESKIEEKDTVREVINVTNSEKKEEREISSEEQSKSIDEMPVLLPVPEESHDINKSSESPRPMSNDSGVSTPTSDTDLPAANPVNIPSSVISHSSDHSAIVSIPSNNDSLNVTNSGSPPPPQTQPPARRRPGRPPGSTKKYRQTAAIAGSPSGAPTPVFRRGTDFTLRKFFEAGGRDYNEYLEWLKRRDNGENVPFLNSNVMHHVSQPQHVPIPGGPIPVVPYQAMPYMQRTVAVPTSPAVPVAYRPMHTQTMNGPIRVPSIHYNYQPQQQPQRPLKRTSEEVLDLRLSTKKTKLDPNGNVIGNVMDFKPLHGGLTNNNLEASEAMPHPMTTWSVERVANFVGAVPGCDDYVEVFREQKIDGATLPHLSEEHLLNIVKMKLGPAIRLRMEVQKLTTVT